MHLVELITVRTIEGLQVVILSKDCFRTAVRIEIFVYVGKQAAQVAYIHAVIGIEQHVAWGFGYEQRLLISAHVGFSTQPIQSLDLPIRVTPDIAVVPTFNVVARIVDLSWKTILVVWVVVRMSTESYLEVPSMEGMLRVVDYSTI